MVFKNHVRLSDTGVESAPELYKMKEISNTGGVLLWKKSYFH
jgi:hypothetical protein